MNKNICRECGTENEIEYVYCKNCGAKLIYNQSNDIHEAPQHINTGAPEFIDGNAGKSQSDYYSAQAGGNRSTEPDSNNSSYSYQQSDPYRNYAPGSGGFNTNSISGIPADEVSLFVGKKAYEILPKFFKMELTHSKISWCWPAAVLGFLLGPMASAIWFFYRKMYKPALILLAIGLVVTCITTALTFDTNSKTFDSVTGAFEKESLSEILNEFSTLDVKQTARDVVANALDRIINISTCILTGLFGFYLYKEHSIKSIRNFRASTLDQRYYRMGLTAAGGVSGGMLAVGIVAIIVVTNISSMLTYVL